MLSMLRAVRRTALRLGRNESGQDIAELVMVTPLLLLVLLGIIEFGGLLDSQQTLSGLSREGANIASRGTAIDTVLAVTMNNGATIGLDTRGGAVVSRLTVSGGAAQIEDQRASPGYTASSRLGAAGDEVAEVTSLGLSNGVTVYAVEVFLTRPPSTPIGSFFGGTIPDVLYDRAIF